MTNTPEKTAETTPLYQPARAVAALAASYIYFLLFAEFAFLELARQREGSGPPLRMIMSLLGFGGLVGSGLSAWVQRRGGWTYALQLGFLSCGAAALCSLLPSNAAVLGAAGWIGVSAGWLTVELATRLESFTGPARLGWVCGLGTGFAYAFSNLPMVFTASPRTQAWVSAAIVVLGALIAPKIHRPQVSAPSGGNRGAVFVVLLFLGLVWLDSGAFYIIQHTGALKAGTWGEDFTLLTNAAVHAGAALIAGKFLDAGRPKLVIAVAALLLVTACWEIHYSDRTRYFTAVFYTAGVSLYSTALVWFPARAARPGFTAALFALAGWCGSALGVGMAQDRHDVPVGVTIACAALVAFSLVRASPTAVKVLTVVAILLIPRALAGAGLDPATIEEGRRVYIAEGCIYCHSQFLRPRVARDSEQWGPGATSLAQRKEQPPLVGTRRQGPDLSNVGNRRSAEWQRWHLFQPSFLVPNSRMPSYAHLFRDQDRRGDALVAYLCSLGADSAAERAARVQQWKPAPTARPDFRAGQALFSELCAMCHGPKGEGDGWLGVKLTVRPPNFHLGSWKHLRNDDPERPLQVSRIIKYGLPGTSMPGHEYLSDDEVVALAAYVAQLHLPGSTLE